MNKNVTKPLLIIVIILLVILVIQIGMLLKTVGWIDWDVRNILGKLNQ